MLCRLQMILEALEEKNLCNRLMGAGTDLKKQQLVLPLTNDQEIAKEKHLDNYLQMTKRKRKKKRKKKKHAMSSTNDLETLEGKNPSSVLECVDFNPKSSTHLFALDAGIEKALESLSRTTKIVMTEKREKSDVYSKRSLILELPENKNLEIGPEPEEIHVDANTVNKKKQLGNRSISITYQTCIEFQVDEHRNTRSQSQEMYPTNRAEKQKDHSREKENKNQKKEEGSILVPVNKQDKPLEEVCMHPGRITKYRERKLLVLDVNGLLADIARVRSADGREHIKLRGRTVFKRPFSNEFLKFCFERFDVGIWSSATTRTVQAVVNFIMQDMKSKLLFCWDRSKCVVTTFKAIEDKRKPLVLKELKKIWGDGEPDLPWKKGDYAPSNTLLLDDSPYKALTNPPRTAIFPYPYRFEEENDNALGPGGDLRVYLEGLAMANDVQEHIRNHPFGQPAITTSHPNWDFYFEVHSQYQECVGQDLSIV